MLLTRKVYQNGKPKVYVNPVNIVCVEDDEHGSFIKTTSGYNIFVSESLDFVVSKMYDNILSEVDPDGKGEIK